MKRKREEDSPERETAAAACSPSGSWCHDDVLRNIFSRLPARAAVASMVLSKHHRRLITSPDFRRLHCRHGAALPVPHIAYVATAPVITCRGLLGNLNDLRGTLRKQNRSIMHGPPRYNPVPVASRYHGFHVAGRGTNPMRALAGTKYVDQKYIGTCNGVLLLAGKKEGSGGFLLNPAIADGEKKVAVLTRYQYIISGFGYGPRTKTYKLLVCQYRKIAKNINVRRISYGGGPGPPPEYEYSLLVYTLGSGEHQPRKVLSGDDAKTSRHSLCIDGTVYLLDTVESTILAFDVDDETITSIDLPGEWIEGEGSGTSHAKSKLMEMSGRLCVATADGNIGRTAIWLLTADHQWERRCVIDRANFGWMTMAGVWDCGSVLLIYMQASGSSGYVYLYDVATEEVTKLDVPPEASVTKSDYRMCWGYKPTLVSPASIVDGELSEDEQRRRDLAADVMATLKPVREVEKRIGQDAAMRPVCFMEFLACIMRKLPHEMQNGIKDIDEFY